MMSRPRTACGVKRVARSPISAFPFCRGLRPRPDQQRQTERDDEQRPRIAQMDDAVSLQEKKTADEQEPDAEPAVLPTEQVPDGHGHQNQRPQSSHAPGLSQIELIAEENHSDHDQHEARGDTRSLFAPHECSTYQSPSTRAT